MNPQQNDPLQPQDNQQPYQNPTVPPAPQQTSSPEQPPVSPQPQYTGQPPKQTGKLPPVLIGGAVIVLGVAVGIFLLLGGDSKQQLSNQDNQSESNQTSTVPQEEDTEVPAQTQEETTEASTVDPQTDTQHKNNLSKLVAAVSEYSANNNGKLPAASEINSVFISQYLNGQFNDPSTSSAYKIVESDPKSGEVQYKTSSTCGSDNTIVSGTRRQVAARVLLSDSAYYCATN